jgi:hypothetical protein
MGKMHFQTPPISRLSRARRTLLAGLLALCAVLALALAGAPRARAAEAGVGMSSPSPTQIADVKALGAHWVRVFATWPDLEPQRGVYAPNWVASYEQMFRALPAGTKVIIDVVDTPRWETGSSDEHTPPANPNDYAAFLAGLAQRWAGRVTAYEIWNEEDSPSWWSGGPNPAAYAQLLKATYPAVKAADPKAAVVLGGLTGNDFAFLEGVYQAGGKGSFDAVGVHTDTACNVLSPYRFLRSPDHRLIEDSFLAYREVHATMLANGDNSPIWMTEASWRTTSATCSEGAFAGQKPQGVSDAAQATYLSQAYHCLAQNPYVQVALWFPIIDEGAVVSGLVRANGSRKPSFASMRAYIHNGDKLKEACGVFTGPKITVAEPSNHLRYTRHLAVRAFAKSSNDVFRLRLEVDGKLIRNFDNRTPSHTIAGIWEWLAADRLSLGKHTLTFLAYDKEQNVSKRNVAIFRVPGKPKHRSSHH